MRIEALWLSLHQEATSAQRRVDPEHPLDPRRVVVGHDLRPAEGALALRRLLLEDVAREGVAAAHLAVGSDFEALLRAGMGLHLGHR